MPISIEDQIKYRFDKIQDRVFSIANSIGRPPESIRIIVVTKSKPLDILFAAIGAGIREFGENYANEAVAKINSVKSKVPGIQWHMIGHIQSRKSGLVVENFDFIHSVDSLKIANKINQIAREQNKKIPILLQVNMSGEPSKYGWPAWEKESWQNLLGEFQEINSFSNLQLKGLMTIAPFGTNHQTARPYFKNLKIFGEYLERNIFGLTTEEYSMGMSSDFEGAILEGATMIRVGSAILGSRDS